MAEQRMALWVAEAELDDDLQDVDPSLAIGNYGQNGHNYDDSKVSTPRLSFSGLPFFTTVDISKSPIDEATILAVQQHMAQQAAFSQIPDVVKAASCLLILPEHRSAR